MNQDKMLLVTTPSVDGKQINAVVNLWFTTSMILSGTAEILSTARQWFWKISLEKRIRDTCAI